MPLGLLREVCFCIHDNVGLYVGELVSVPCQEGGQEQTSTYRKEKPKHGYLNSK